MTISYNTDSSLAGLGSFAVSITDNNGVPYPTNVAVSIAVGAYAKNVYGVNTASGFSIAFDTASATSQLSVGQSIFVTGTNQSAFNNNYYKIIALGPYKIYADITDGNLLTSGASYANGSSFLTDDSANWGTNAYVGDTVIIGTSIGVINSNTSNTLYVTWSYGPPSGIYYQIYGGHIATGGLATLSYAPQTRTFPVDTSFEIGRASCRERV